MKKILLFGIVLLFPSLVTAAGHVELRVAPEDVNLAGYQPSETITIQVYATGFYTNSSDDTIGFVDVAAITTDNNGIASAPSLHSELDRFDVSPGTIVNSGGVLISNIAGYMSFGDLDGVTPFPAVLWECEFHIPDLTYSSIITISLDGLSLKNVGFNDIDPAYTVSGLLEIHVVSVCCPGDTDNDGDIDFDDFTEILVLLVSVGLERKQQSLEPWYLIECSDPNYNECMDLDSDSDFDIHDYNRIKANISYANWLLTGGPPADPCYMITPDDPCVGFLWPCD